MKARLVWLSTILTEGVPENAVDERPLSVRRRPRHFRRAAPSFSPHRALDRLHRDGCDTSLNPGSRPKTAAG